jgi:hypothetical protein
MEGEGEDDPLNDKCQAAIRRARTLLRRSPRYAPLEDAIERLERALLARRAGKKGSTTTPTPVQVQRLRERLRKVRQGMAADLLSGRPPSAAGIIALDEAIEDMRTW